MPAKLVLLRHGQSEWNLKNLFTGWTDVELTDQGRAEAAAAAKLLIEKELFFDVAYTSVLKRAIQTQLENPLAQAILSGHFGPGDEVQVDVKEGQLFFESASGSKATAA